MPQTVGLKDGLAKRGQQYCLNCGKPESFSRANTHRDICDSCRAKLNTECVVFDRDRHIGSLPKNLEKYLG